MLHNAIKPIKTVASVTDSSINFHVDSDLCIQVTGTLGPVNYLVASCTLSTASAVWRKLLYGEDAKQRPADGDWLIQFADDDPQALETLLRIVHFDFAKVPLEPTLDELYEITKLTAKYQATHIAYPWSSKWLALFDALDIEGECVAKAHKALWVVWELGHIELFKKVADIILVNTMIDGDGNLVNKAGKLIETDNVLPRDLLGWLLLSGCHFGNAANAITDSFARIRAKTVDQILSHIKNAIDHVSHIKRQDDRKYCQRDQDSDACENMLLGCAMRGLISQGMYPIPSAGEYKGSINDLKVIIDEIKFTDYRGSDYAPHKSHKGCTLHLKEEYAEATAEGVLEHAYTDKHEKHVLRQARISGLNRCDPVGSPLSPVASKFQQEDVADDSTLR